MKTRRVVAFNKRILSFLPYKRVIIKTTLSLDEAVDLIAGSISPIYNPIWQSPPQNIKKLQGNTTRERFTIRPTSYYQGSLAYLSGKFIPASDGLIISMYIYPNPVLFVMLLAGIAMIFGFFGGETISELIIGIVIIIIFILGFILEVDSLDWHISNLIGNRIAKNKK